jgi:hypothetical protein
VFHYAVFTLRAGMGVVRQLQACEWGPSMRVGTNAAESCNGVRISQCACRGAPRVVRCRHDLHAILTSPTPLRFAL